MRFCVCRVGFHILTCASVLVARLPSDDQSIGRRRREGNEDRLDRRGDQVPSDSDSTTKPESAP